MRLGLTMITLETVDEKLELEAVDLEALERASGGTSPECPGRTVDLGAASFMETLYRGRGDSDNADRKKAEADAVYKKGLADKCWTSREEADAKAADYWRNPKR